MPPLPEPLEQRTRGDKIPKVDLQARILRVATMLEEAAPRHMIIEECTTEYGVSRSTVDRYIDEAHQQFKETYRPQMQRSAEIAKRRLETIFYRAMKKEDFKTALAAQALLNKIQGLCDNMLMAGLRRSDTNSRKSY
jgi:hypothetical protein